MPLRFIHTADIHLDSPLSGLSTYVDAPLTNLRTATRRAFEGLVDYALGERVDFVVIAGDLYDGTWKDYNTGLFFAAQMGRLKQANIRVVLLYGNHDAESDLTRATRLRLPDNVYVFDSRAAHRIAFEDLRVVFHGRSFWQRDVTENLVKQYPDPLAGWFNVGVLHTALGGREGHAAYAPTTLDELRAKSYDYWALGHVHAADVLERLPHIAFSGSLQGRHIREPGAHGAYVVEVEDNCVTRLTRIETDVLRWCVLTIDLDETTSMDEILSDFETRISNALDASFGRSLAIRVVIRGRTNLHGELFRQEPHLRAQMQAIAVGFGPDRAWIEKLCLDTEPLLDLGEALPTRDILTDLHAMLLEAADSPKLLDELKKEYSDLTVKLIPEVRNASELLLEHLREGRLDEIVRVVAPHLLSQVADR